MDYGPQIHTFGQMRQRIAMAAPAANPPHSLDVRGVPALMVHDVYDSSDPYSWAHSLAAQIQGGAVLTRLGDGHTSYYTSACARAAMDQYLIRPPAPPDRVRAE